MPKEEIAMLSPILVALGMVIPVAIGHITAGPKPMAVFLWGYPLRIVVTIVYLWVLPLSRQVPWHRLEIVAQTIDTTTHKYPTYGKRNSHLPCLPFFADNR